MSRFKRNGKDSLIAQPRKRKEGAASAKNGKSKGNGNNNNGLNGGNGNGKLTPLMENFVGEYLKDLNGTQAVIRAGYSGKGADVRAAWLLGDIRIQKAVQKRRNKLAAKLEMDQEWVLNGYRKLVDYTLDEIYSDDGTLKSIGQISANARFAVSGMKVLKTKTLKTYKDGGESESETVMQDLKFSDKKGVLDQVGKHLGMFQDENDQDRSKFNFNGPVQINIGLEDE